jgi:hypothetical protein
MTFRKPAAARSSRIKAQTAKQTQQSTKQQMKKTTTTVSTVLYSALMYVYPTNTCSFLFQISWQQVVQASGPACGLKKDFCSLM